MAIAPVADPLAWPILEALEACLEDQVRCLVKPPAVTSVRPGDRIELLIAQTRDECCEGLAWVRCVTVYPSADFPAPDTEASQCGPTGWAVVVELGVARCAPTTDANIIPTAAQWSDVTAAVMADAAAVRRAVALFKTLDDFEDVLWVVGAWLPLPTEGGCVGGAMQITVSAVPCDQTGVCTDE